VGEWLQVIRQVPVNRSELLGLEEALPYIALPQFGNVGHMNQLARLPRKVEGPSYPCQFPVEGGVGGLFFLVIQSPCDVFLNARSAY